MLKTEGDIKNNENSAQSDLKAVEQYKIDVLKMVDNKEEQLLLSLDRVREYCLQQFQIKKEKALKEIEKMESIEDVEQAKNLAIHIGLPFTDQAKHLQEKISNVLHTKQFYLNVNAEMSKAIKLTESETTIAKDNFDLVCNYQKRREKGIPSEDLYNKELCKYLVQKTFKKSAVDAYSTASSFNLNSYLGKEKDIVKIVCVGGGPGSDLTGILCYLMELGYFKFDCLIYDYNASNWKEVCTPYLREILISQTKKSFGREIDIKIDWEFCDIKKDWSDKSKIPVADVFSICWALNESIYYQNFWEDLISKNEKGIFFFIDGDRYPIENFRNFQSLQNRKHLYEGLETPRRLTVFPL